MALNCNLNDKTVEASKVLDENLNLFKQNFSEAKDYLKIIVKVFENTLKKASEDLHLRNFYMIVPVLTINHVENMSISKEKLLKRNENGATFTDDGFEMGIAYCLRTLNQITEFESIQWFNNVNEEFENKMNLIEQKQKSDNDEKLSQTSTLTIKKLKSLQTEFSLLEYNLGSCLCLFRKMD